MKYLKTIPILFLALLFSANINAFAYSKNYVSNTIKDDIYSYSINKKEDIVEVFNQNNSSIYLTQDDLNLMAKIVYAESKGEPYDGKVAVASVILNRVVSSQFPNSINDVIFQNNAFSCIIDGEISVTPTQECYDAVSDAISGKDPTGDALFYYNPKIATCPWMDSVKKVGNISIGEHLFFNITK